jgi:predicted ABC-type ATPase
MRQQPWMWIVAGPNGAGKSSLTAKFLKNLGVDSLIKLNADDVTASLLASGQAGGQDEVNLVAARMVDAQVEACIREGKGFLVETVLSSGKYRDDVEAAKAAGFRVGMMFVSLHPPELSPLRVAQRVLRGGHHVDPERAIARYHRSHEELAWFAVRADTLFVFDNSRTDIEPLMLVQKDAKKREILWGRNPAVDRAMAVAFPS